MSKRDRLLQKLSEIAIDPVRFVREVLRDDPWSVQEEILRSLATNSQTAVKACNSSGKTRIAAEAVLWWIIRYSDGIAVTTAPTYEQVQKLLWGEIHQAIARCRDFKWPTANLAEVKLSAGNYAVGLSTNKGVNFQGFHSPHLLIVVDEAPGVEADIWEAIEGARAGGEVHLLVLGNPTMTGGSFYDAFTKQRELWNTFSIDAFDTPNLAGFTLEYLRQLPPNLPESDPVFQYKPLPSLVTRRWVYEKYRTWGEDSPLWQARVRGEFPTQAEDALISLGWLEAAGKRAASNSGGTLYAGIDVAGPGKDETVAVVRNESGAILAQMASAKPDPRGAVVNFLAPFKGRLDSVNVDSVGIGYNFATHLKDRGYRVRFVNVGQSSRFPDKFANFKAQLYWSLRERFEAGEVAGLTDELTIAQLASIRYEYNPRGQVVIESKDDARKRGVKSPDRADAIMLAFAQMTPGITTYYRREGLRNLVQQGWSVGEIAERFRTTPEQIQSWNDEIRAENPQKRTFSGRFFRPPRPTLDDPDVREIFDAACKLVEAGEDDEEVARKAGIDVEQLRGYLARANAPIGPRQPWDSLVEKLLAARAAGNYLDINIDAYRGRIRNMLRADGRAAALTAELDKRFGI